MTGESDQQEEWENGPKESDIPESTCVHTVEEAHGF